MPCGQTNLKAAFFLGIALAVLRLLSCGWVSTTAIVIGIIGALIHGILIFGAHTRNSTAIVVWMVLACLANAGYGWMAGSLIYLIAKYPALVTALVYFWFFVFFGVIFFLIWTISVAKKARVEIEAGEF